MRAGHHVDALVRNREKAAAVQARGAPSRARRPRRGPDDVRGSGGGSRWVDSRRDATIRPAAHALDALALDTLLAPARARADRFFIYTSGVWVLGPAPTPVDESSPINPIEQSAWRAPHEQRVLAAAGPDLRTIVVRPGIVYGGSRGIVGDMFKSAANGLVRVIGTGENHWPLVYDRDLGELYLMLATSPTASGVFHANDECDERVNDLVAAIAGTCRSVRASARCRCRKRSKKMGPYADALALDQIVRSPRARALGWTPSLHAVSRNAARLFEEWRTRPRGGA